MHSAGGGLVGDGDARLVGRNVLLRPLVSADYEMLYLAEHSESLGPRWRFQGATLSPERFRDALWRGVTAQFVVTEHTSPRPVGLVALYDVDHADQYGYFAVADLATGGSPTRVAQGAVLFLSYVFNVWPLRKLYAQTAEFNVDQFRGWCGKLLVEEGRLHEHHYYGGKHWDEYTFALYREAWLEWEGRVLRPTQATTIAPGLLTFEAFVARLALELEISSLDAPKPDIDLADDLSFDSLTFVAALGAIEGLGATVDDKALATARTLGDLYHLYAIGATDADCVAAVASGPLDRDHV